MAKKPRSQRRKKGGGSGGSDGFDSGGGGDGDVGGASGSGGAGGGGDWLSEDHTIADTGSVGTNLSSNFEDEFSFGGGDEDRLGNIGDDYLSLVGRNADHHDAAVAAAADRLSKLTDTLIALEEYSSEKRTVKREAMLRRVFRSLTRYATGPSGCTVVSNRCDVIRKACFIGIRSGGPAEQYAACRVLEATAIALGGDQDEWTETLDRQLRRVVETTSRAVPVRMAALRALSMSVFICTNDSMTTESLMDLCEMASSITYRNESPVPTSLRATALDCWALLATTIGDFDLAGTSEVQMGRGLAILELLKECLDTSSVELRSAAGECFSLIHEARLKLGVMADEDPDTVVAKAGAADAGNHVNPEEMNVTERRYRRGSWDGTPWEVLMDEVKQQISECAVESNRYMSKKAKKEQRATFREFMATIVDDEAPQEVVQFRNHGSITLNSWREIIQLNFVRHCLQSGFQIQLLTNETLQVIFGADGRVLNPEAHGIAAASMSQLEKRLLLSKTSEASKNADLDLKSQRRKRQNVKNHFLTADGDDL